MLFRRSENAGAGTSSVLTLQDALSRCSFAAELWVAVRSTKARRPLSIEGLEHILQLTKGRLRHPDAACCEAEVLSTQRSSLGLLEAYDK
jgi:hypothetical protein